MDYTAIMPTDLMSNLLNQAGSVRDRGMLYAADTDAFVASVHPADVGAVAAAALQGGHEGEELVVTGPEAASPRDIAAKLAAVLGREIELVALDEDALRNGMLAAGLPEWTVEGLLELYRSTARARRRCRPTPSRTSSAARAAAGTTTSARTPEASRPELGRFKPARHTRAHGLEQVGDLRVLAQRERVLPPRALATRSVRASACA